MATQRRDEPVPVKSGTAGRAKEVTGAESAAPRPKREELDARQERIRLQRRKGPELPPGEPRPEAEAQQDVPPTECDEEGDE
jgi:hypothetical protein